MEARQGRPAPSRRQEGVARISLPRAAQHGQHRPDLSAGVREGRRGAHAAFARLGGLHAAARGGGVRAGALRQHLSPAPSGSVSLPALQPDSAQWRELWVLPKSGGGPRDRGGAARDRRDETDRALPPSSSDRRGGPPGGLSLERGAVLGRVEEPDRRGGLFPRPLPLRSGPARLEADPAAEALDRRPEITFGGETVRLRRQPMESSVLGPQSSVW